MTEQERDAKITELETLVKSFDARLKDVEQRQAGMPQQIQHMIEAAFRQQSAWNRATLGK